MYLYKFIIIIYSKNNLYFIKYIFIYYNLLIKIYFDLINFKF